MTSDGISGSDWERMRSAWVDLVNSSETWEEEVCRERIRVLLEELEEKYGEKPSLIATMADLVDDESERLGLFEKAAALSEQSEDTLNLGLISHSLVEYYCEHDAPEQAIVWLRKLEKCAEVEDLAEELQEARDLIAESLSED